MRDRRFVWVLAFAVVAAAGLAVQAADYVGADKCKMCHKVQYSSWEQTTHAKATEAAKASTDPAFGPDCLKCHATNKNAESMGVECEACHGPGSDYKKMSIMKDREASIANGLVIPSQETCNACHVDDGHSKAVDFKAQVNNKAAIHEFKNPPSH